MDFGELLPIIMYVVIAVMVLSVCMPIILWLLNRSKHWIDRPYDVTQAVLKKLVKGGKANKKGVSQAKWLVCLGEEDYYNFMYGKIVGIYSGKFADEFIVKTGRLKPSKLFIVPKELRRDLHGSNVIIECNGFMPIAHFYGPVFTSKTDEKVIQAYMTLIYNQWDWHVQNEKIFESVESGAHAMSEALDVKRVNWNIIKREDYIQKQPGNPEEGEQYAEQTA